MDDWPREAAMADTFVRSLVGVLAVALAVDLATLLATVVFFSGDGGTYATVDRLRGIGFVADLSLALLALPTLALVARWLLSSYRRVLSLAPVPAAIRFHPVWAWAGWLVPILQAVRPAEVLADVSRLALADPAERSSGRWTVVTLPAHVRLFAICWGFALAALLASGFLLEVRSMSPGLLTLQLAFDVAMDAMFAGAGVALLWTIDLVETRLAPGAPIEAH